VGFKQRQRERQRKAAIAAAQQKARQQNPTSGKWWLTIVSATTCCAVCGGILRKGAEMVYRHTPREARCTSCAAGLSYRPSTRWEQQRRKAA
jgi:hypothetical protein